MAFDEKKVIAQTQAWLKEVVIGFGFCPFASKPFLQNNIRYRVLRSNDAHLHPQVVLEEIQILENQLDLETTLVIFAESYSNFSNYWSVLRTCEKQLRRKGFEGLYQLASFHPKYVFGDAPDEDPANYTNRSPYPMIHIIREDSLSKAIKHYPNPEEIPIRNMAFARNKGLDFMKGTLERMLKL